MAKKFRNTLQGSDFRIEADDARLFGYLDAMVHAFKNPQIYSHGPVPPLPSYQAQIQSTKSAMATRWKCGFYPEPHMKIKAIKIFRQISGYGLADAKNWVEGSITLMLDPMDVARLFQADFVPIMIEG